MNVSIIQLTIKMQLICTQLLYFTHTHLQKTITRNTYLTTLISIVTPLHIPPPPPVPTPLSRCMRVLILSAPLTVLHVVANLCPHSKCKPSLYPKIVPGQSSDRKECEKVSRSPEEKELTPLPVQIQFRFLCPSADNESMR